MKSKLLLIGLLAILLTGCEKYRYDVTYEKCNGKTGSLVSYTVPERSTGFYGEGRIIADGVITNVCDFSYTKTLIQDNQ